LIKLIPRMMPLKIFAFMILFFTVSQIQPAMSFLITSGHEIPIPTALVDFSNFGGAFLQTDGPIDVGNSIGESIEWSSTYSSSVIGTGGIGINSYGLSGNGSWDYGMKGFVGLSTRIGSMRFDFNDGPVSAVGGFVNYATAPNYINNYVIEALGIGDTLLEGYAINIQAPIYTPGQINAGAFRGIVRSSQDIVAFRLSGDWNVLDNLQFSRTLIPEPNTLLLFGSGLICLTGFRRKFRTRRRKS